MKAEKWIRVGTSMVCGDACIDKRQCAGGVCFALRFRGEVVGDFESFAAAEQELPELRRQAGELEAAHV